MPDFAGIYERPFTKQEKELLGEEHHPCPTFRPQQLWPKRQGKNSMDGRRNSPLYQSSLAAGEHDPDDQGNGATTGGIRLR
jgi:hypothetical protein